MNNIKDHGNLNQKKVLLRLDLNVPLKNGIILDQTRINKILPVIRFLLSNNAKIIIVSHVGRPQGSKNKDLSLKPIGKNIEKKINRKIKIIENQKNIGVGRSRNIGIKYSKSKYIAFIDSDDLWNKNKLKFQIKFMLKEKIPISHTSYFLINEDGEKISIRNAKKNLFFNDLIKSCDIGLSTVMVKTSFLKKNNLYFPSLSTKEDYVLWLRLIKISKVIKGFNPTLTYYRKRKNSLSSNLIISLANGYKVYRYHLKSGILESLVRLFILSLYAIKKKIIK